MNWPIKCSSAVVYPFGPSDRPILILFSIVFMIKLFGLREKYAQTKKTSLQTMASSQSKATIRCSGDYFATQIELVHTYFVCSGYM